jgi:four helix bundle protein
MKRENIIQEKSFDFALKIIQLYKELTAVNEYVLSKQLLKSGTSIGANVEEAVAGISKKDFTAKMSISSKEARESKYWLRLIQSGNFLDKNISDYIKDIDEIISILTAIVKSSQQSMK